jgi:hypothetical protein
MGFPDDKRNSTVLKGLNGNLDRTVEALIRLGEQNPGKSRGSTPTPPVKSSNNNGLSFDSAQTSAGAMSSNNPFDALDAIAAPPRQQPAPLQTQQMPYTDPSAQVASPSNSYNPFLAQMSQAQHQQSVPPQQQQLYTHQSNPYAQQQQQQQQQNLEQSLQHMQLSNPQPQQPLFPNRTGGYGPTQAPYAQTNPFQQSFTPPPMPQIPEQYSAFYAPQPQYQSMSSPSSPGNPFLRSTKSQIFSPANPSSNPFGQQQVLQQQQGSNPFAMHQPTHTPATQTPNPWQSPPQNYPQASFQQPQTQTSTPQASNPWHNQQQNFPQSGLQQQQTYSQSGFQQQQQSQQQPSFQQQQNQQQPTFQQQGHQQSDFQQNTGPFDKKSSIMSLYSQPQLAPQRPEQFQTPAAAPLATGSTGPVSGYMNPFATTSGAQQGQSLSAAQTPGVRHVSNESVDFAGLMGGRHSPDAFSGLSASFRR